MILYRMVNTLRGLPELLESAPRIVKDKTGERKSGAGVDGMIMWSEKGNHA
jgi:hypothetical protein